MVFPAYEDLAPYRNSIIAGGLLVVVAAVAFVLLRNHYAAQAAEGWNAVESPEAIWRPIYAVPRYAERYVGMMDKAAVTYNGSPAASGHELLAADTQLAIGQDQLMGKETSHEEHQRRLESTKSSRMAR